MCIEQTRNGTAPNRPDLQWKGFEPLRSDLQGRSSGMQRNSCDQQRQGCALRWKGSAKREIATEKNGYAWRWRSEERRWHGWGCPALRGISGQRTCIGAEKRGARQVHREARALIRQAKELHCRAYAKALKCDALHRHRGAVTRYAKEMSSMDKRGVRHAKMRFGIA